MIGCHYMTRLLNTDVPTTKLCAGIISCLLAFSVKISSQVVKCFISTHVKNRGLWPQTEINSAHHHMNKLGNKSFYSKIAHSPYYYFFNIAGNQPRVLRLLGRYHLATSSAFPTFS